MPKRLVAHFLDVSWGSTLRCEIKMTEITFLIHDKLPWQCRTIDAWRHERSANKAKAGYLRPHHQKPTSDGKQLACHKVRTGAGKKNERRGDIPIGVTQLPTHRHLLSDL